MKLWSFDEFTLFGTAFEVISGQCVCVCGGSGGQLQESGSKADGFFKLCYQCKKLRAYLDISVFNVQKDQRDGEFYRVKEREEHEVKLKVKKVFIYLFIQKWPS